MKKEPGVASRPTWLQRQVKRLLKEFQGPVTAFLMIVLHFPMRRIQLLSPLSSKGACINLKKLNLNNRSWMKALPCALLLDLLGGCMGT